MRMLAASPDPEDNPPNLVRVVQAMITTVRRQGYAERDPNVEPRSSNTVAVPIRLGDAIAGTIGLSYFRSAVSHAVLVGELVPALHKASQEITASMERLQRARDGQATVSVPAVPSLPAGLRDADGIAGLHSAIRNARI
jgi:IclR family mhp operon transcriptional activator